MNARKFYFNIKSRCMISIKRLNLIKTSFDVNINKEILKCNWRESELQEFPEVLNNYQTKCRI